MLKSRRTGLIVIVLSVVLAVAHTMAHKASAQAPIDQADFDGNGIVDFGDFLTFAAGFGSSTGSDAYNPALDFDVSGAVDFTDFLVFVASFSASTSEPAATFVYIADTAAGEVKAFDTATNFEDPSRRLAATTPQDVFFSDLRQRFYVSSLDTFYAFSAAGAPIYTLPLTEASDLGFVASRAGSKMAVSPDQTTAYVAELFGPVIEVIDLDQGASQAFIDVPDNPKNPVLNASGTRLFVAHGGSNVARSVAPLTVIDTGTLTVVDSFSVGDSGVNRLALNPNDGTLYTNNAIGSTLVALDPTSGNIVHSVDVGTINDLSVQILDVAASPDGQFVYFTVNRIVNAIDAQGVPTLGFLGGLGILDADTFEQVGEVIVGEVAANLGVSPDGSTAYISGSESLTEVPPSIKIFIVDLTTRQAAGTLQGFELPSDISFSAGKPAIGETGWPQITVF